MFARTSAIIDEVPVRQNFFAMPTRPLPVSAPPPIAAGAIVADDQAED